MQLQLPLMTGARWLLCSAFLSLSWSEPCHVYRLLQAWFCTGLDVVYSGKSGYQIGFRAQNINEEAKEAKEL